MQRVTGMSLKQQIVNSLQAEISKLPYGAQIETEQQLAERYDASRGTVRNAVSELVNEGLLYKLQGRGTFKGGAAVQYASHYATSLTEQLLASGMVPGIADATLETVVPDAMIAHHLGIEATTPVWKFRRLRLANGTPIAVGTAFIRKDLVPMMRIEDVSMSFVDLIRNTYQIPIVRTKSYCTASLADASLAESLCVQPNAAIFRIEHFEYTTGLLPLFVDTTEAIGDRYALRLVPACDAGHDEQPVKNF